MDKRSPGGQSVGSNIHVTVVLSSYYHSLSFVVYCDNLQMISVEQCTCKKIFLVLNTESGLKFFTISIKREIIYKSEGLQQKI